MRNKQILLGLVCTFICALISVQAFEPTAMATTVLSQEEAMVIARDMAPYPDLELIEVRFESEHQTSIMYLDGENWEEVLRVTEADFNDSVYTIKSENEAYKFIVEIDANTGSVIGLEKISKAALN